MTSAGEDSLRGERRRALALSWLAYATYYFGRKTFSAVKKPMQHELGLTSGALGAIDTAFLSAYAVGQFGSGLLGDRIGSRRLVGYGMLASAAACAAFGSSSGFFAFASFFLLNGLAQSTGWPGTTRIVSEWTPSPSRGTVMGVWATCYQVGGLSATFVAGFLAARFGWRSALLVPAGLIFIVGGLVLLALPRPPSLTQEGTQLDTLGVRTEASRAAIRLAQRHALGSKTLWLLGTSYFFIKLIRYAVLFWLPYYLATEQGYSIEKAANVSLAFDAGGILGVIVIGRFADRFRWGKSVLSALWIVALVPVLGVYARFDHQGTLANVLALVLLGALLCGPDSLLPGAAAQDAGGLNAASTATGFVNGIGSFGAVLQGLVVPRIAERFGWVALFPALSVFALAAVLALLLTLGRDKPAA